MNLFLSTAWSINHHPQNVCELVRDSTSIPVLGKNLFPLCQATLLSDAITVLLAATL
jgi:hypothetical protein